LRRKRGPCQNRRWGRLILFHHGVWLACRLQLHSKRKPAWDAAPRDAGHARDASPRHARDARHAPAPRDGRDAPAPRRPAVGGAVTATVTTLHHPLAPLAPHHTVGVAPRQCRSRAAHPVPPFHRMSTPGGCLFPVFSSFPPSIIEPPDHQQPINVSHVIPLRHPATFQSVSNGHHWIVFYV